MELGPFPKALGYEEAKDLDDADALAPFRDRFSIHDSDLIYLDGNSLGRLPKTAPALIDDAAQRQWGDRLIRSWNEGWWEAQLKLGDMLVPLLGAAPGEVVISDSTSVNLYKLAQAALGANPDRSQIVTDDLNFPTDIYILEGIAEQSHRTLRIIESDGIHGPVDQLRAAINEDTALVSLSHTVFKSGYTYEIEEVTKLGHESGALVLWDCSHSVGALPIDLGAADVDLAVGCTYKYLNGGPGAPSWLYVRSDLHEELSNPIKAWWGHAEPFNFGLEFEPVSGIRKFHTGTMPILSMVAIEAGLTDVLDAGIDRIRTKSIQLSEYLIGQVEAHLSPFGFRMTSPRDPADRGSHVSVAHENAWPITRALVETASVIPDFRTPDNIRFGLAPLYNSYLDIHTAIQRLRGIVESHSYLEFADATAAVT